MAKRAQGTGAQRGKAAAATPAKRWLCLLAAAVLLVCVVLLEIGQRYPQSGLPGWDTLYAWAGLDDGTPAPEGTLEVHAIDVGNADSLLISQGDRHMLIDAGEKGDGDTVVSYLRQHGVERLDLVIATHPHADHIGGMATVIRSIPIDRFIMATMPQGSTPTSKVYRDMLTALDEQNVTVTEAEPEAVYRLGSAQVTLLAPLEETDEPNDMSVVSRVDFGKRSFLFMGDAEKNVEKLMLERYPDLHADVIKVGHHGSSTASTDAFIAAVAPRYAIVTCGEGNSYGHPHKEAIAVLQKYGVEIWRCDTDGSIRFSTDGDTLSVKGSKGE